MTDFLTGLVARARDGVPALARRRPSLFEAPAQPAAPAGGPGLGRLRALGPQDPGDEWDGPVDETATVESPRPAEPTAGSRRPPRGRSGRPAVQRSGDTGLSPGLTGTEGAGELEPANLAAPPGEWGWRTTGNPAPGRTVEPAASPAPPSAASEASVAWGPRGSSLARTMETIVETPASAQPGAPLVPLQAGPGAGTGGLERPFEAVVPLRGDSDFPAPAEPNRPRRDHRQVPGAASGEHDVAPVRPLRRPGSATAGPGTGSLGRRELPAAPPSPPPAIHVTIGRIEVRATPARTPAPAQAPRPSGPKLGLDEYLRSRSGRAG